MEKQKSEKPPKTKESKSNMENRLFPQNIVYPNRRRVFIFSIVELKRRFAPQPRAVRCGGSSRACRAPANGRRKAHREQAIRPLLDIRPPFFARDQNTASDRGPEARSPPRPSGPDSRAPPNNNATQTTPRATKTPRNKGTPRAGTPRGRPLQAVSHGATNEQQRREKSARFAGFVQILLGGGKNRHADCKQQAAQAKRPHYLFSRSGNRQGHPAGEDRRRTAPHRPSQPKRREHRFNPTI